MDTKREMTNEELAFKAVKTACQHDYGMVHCPACATKLVEIAKGQERQRVVLAIEEYGRTDMTLSRLGELLDQSPPVLRVILGRAADRFVLEADRDRYKAALEDAERKGRDLCLQNGELLMLIADVDVDHHTLRGSRVRLDGHETCGLCERIERVFGMDRATNGRTAQ